jgi:hypothetical protein
MGLGSSLAWALQPCSSGLDDYRKLLHSELMSGAPKQATVAFLAIPSFAPEYGLAISQENGVAQATVVRFIESVWYGSVEEVSPGLMSHVFSKSKVKAAKKQFSISSELAVLVTSLLTAEVARTRDTDLLGLDGETFVFTAAGGKCAETWSPDKETRDELLVRTFEEVGDLGKIPNAVARATAERQLLHTLRTRWRAQAATPNTSLERARDR